MARWFSLVVATIALVLLVGCAAPISPISPVGSVSAGSVRGRDIDVTAPDSVTSYLTALRDGNLTTALASVDSEESPAGADTAENVYRFLGTGRIRLQSWELVGATTTNEATSNEGRWVFIVCQIAFADGRFSEVPLTFKTNASGKIVLVG